ncbi:MAG: tripartite tricarboxylate transporter permease [Candidatus Caldatribacteriota bacterium]
MPELILQVLSFKIIIIVATGVLGGIIVGSIPGLTVTMAAAILISFTYGWNLIEALALILGVYAGGFYGGSQSAILVNIPGAPSAIATGIDGYPLALKGEAGEAIGLATVESFLGGLIGITVLALVAPPISKFALQFRSHEYFLLGIFGLTMISKLASKSLVKGIISASLGIFISLIGLDVVYGAVGRFTYGKISLMGGIHFVPALIGLFAIAEVLTQLEKNQSISSIIPRTIGKIPKLSVLKRYLYITIRSSFIGTFIGALPGVGGTISALVAYDDVQRYVKKPSRPFGTGAYEGVIAPESANNATIGGALIPALTLGIPGDAVTALIIGAFFLHGLRPGPLLMVRSPDIFWVIVFIGILSNIFLLILGLLYSRISIYVITVKSSILMPIIVIICAMGSYVFENNIFHIQAMLVLGIIGWLMRKFDFSIGAMVLGIILGPIIDDNLRRALLLSQGSNILVSFLSKPISAVLIFLILSLF